MTDATQIENNMTEQITHTTARTAAHLERIAPWIAQIKVDSPDDWEAAYQDAEEPGPKSEFNITPPRELSTQELAAEMKKVKMAWGQLGMYAMVEVVDPNPRVAAYKDVYIQAKAEEGHPLQPLEAAAKE